MRWELTTIGEINHKNSEADCAIFDSFCTRCGWSDPDSQITSYPKHNLMIEDFLFWRNEGPTWRIPDNESDG